MNYNLKNFFFCILIVIFLIQTNIFYANGDKNIFQQDINKSNLKNLLSKYRDEAIYAELSTTCPNYLSNSSWSMYCHDSRHTGQSPFNTFNNFGIEKWRTSLAGWVQGSPVVDDAGVIYIGCDNFYAIYSNGTIKWSYNTLGSIMSAAVIDENGIIYVGTIWTSPCFYAFFSNGTVKWSYGTGNDIFSSPVISTDGAVIFGDYNGYINALYCSNGTLRWRFHTNGFIDSSPAIGEDGIVYCGSADGNLYALYPNNGTLKWSYQTGDWVGRGPAIADDGTIYFGSWDGYLYATYPDGTLKWKTSGYLAGTTPVIGQDGTVYVGNRYLSAVYPENGSVKWTFDPGADRRIIGSNPAISADGTIYFGTHIGETSGGEIIAIDQNGTERWRKEIATLWVDSSPAIATDETVYIGSTNDLAHVGSEGYLHAFGPGEQKNFEISNPLVNHIYFFGKDIGVSKKGNTVVIGSDTIQLDINSEVEVESVSFLLGTPFHYFNQYTDTEPPYEWKMNKRYAVTPIFNHELNIVANYKGGCQWTETIHILYFHLRNNQPE